MGVTISLLMERTAHLLFLRDIFSISIGIIISFKIPEQVMTFVLDGIGFIDRKHPILEFPIPSFYNKHLTKFLTSACQNASTDVGNFC